MGKMATCGGIKEISNKSLAQCHHCQGDIFWDDVWNLIMEFVSMINLRQSSTFFSMSL